MKWMVNCSVVNPRIRLYPECFPLEADLELIVFDPDLGKNEENKNS